MVFCLEDHMASTNSENNLLKRVDFLTEDLKETGEHLRDTDRKITFLVQLYAGSFGIITAIIGLLVVLIDKGIINLSSLKLEDLTLYLMLIITFYVSLTFWLLEYTLKGRETKQTYINRMNFLRREIHYNLRTSNSDLPGFWTGVGKNNKKIGMDDLYPFALTILIIVCNVLFIGVLMMKPEWNVIVIGTGFFNLFFLVRSFILWRMNNKAIENLSKSYARSTRNP
jgi:hypothetical protein